MDVKTFRNNLFSMNTRRFGTVAELMIKKLILAEKGANAFHDLKEGKTRIEVKFSRAEKKHTKRINETNVLDVIQGEGLEVRMFPSHEWPQHDWFCNIQQVKPAEFDVLYYGIFFADSVKIFVLTPKDLKAPGLNYCDKQHKGNVGEGQFHITKRSMPHHILNHYAFSISYADLMKLFINDKVEMF